MSVRSKFIRIRNSTCVNASNSRSKECLQRAAVKNDSVNVVSLHPHKWQDKLKFQRYFHFYLTDIPTDFFLFKNITEKLREECPHFIPHQQHGPDLHKKSM